MDAIGPLQASSVVIEARAPVDPLAQACLRAYSSEIEQRFGTRFESGGDDGLALLFVAVVHAEPIGCGGLKLHADGPPEIKRLWTAPAARGMGLGRRLLGELERAAADGGAARIRLDTNRALTEAITLYRSTGYQEIERYNDNPYAHHWFEKQLS